MDIGIVVGQSNKKENKMFMYGLYFICFIISIIVIKQLTSPIFKEVKIKKNDKHEFNKY